MNHSNELKVQIPGTGGPLRGSLLTPPSAQPTAAVLICNATGVPARYYLHFARWLAAERGMAALAWDYRDFGESGHPRRSRATLADWGIDDAATARRWLAGRFPGIPIWIVGHSLGGLAMPFQPELEAVDRVITVAAGPVHLSDHPWRHKVLIGSIWHGHGPLLTAMLGHFPGTRLGFGADIPGPAYWQWRRWCSRRGSVMADRTLPPLASDRLRAPVTLVAFSDDPLVPPPAVWRLADLLPQAPVTRRLIRPEEHGLKSIGHVGAFAPRCRSVWPALVEA
ncbi:MAG: alpha/beta hydrolase [Pirellulaceae bacterium]|nr:alpha/beta hydrolase [Pirellulaceae bacterium]